MTVLDVSEYIIVYAKEHALFVSNLKLQKTLYYVQGYFLAETGSPAFQAECEAWQYGPVFPDAYFKYNSNGGDGIEPSVKWFEEEPCQIVEKSLLDRIVRACLKIQTNALVSKTHGETPWCDAFKRKNKLITMDAIRDYFKDNDPLCLKGKFYE